MLSTLSLFPPPAYIQCARYKKNQRCTRNHRAGIDLRVQIFATFAFNQGTCNGRAAQTTDSVDRENHAHFDADLDGSRPELASAEGTILCILTAIKP